MHVNGSTSARSPTTPVDSQFSSGTHTDGSASARPSGNSDSHSDSQSDSQSDNLVDDYWATLIHPCTQLSFWSSILFTLCLGCTTVSQFINSKRFTPLSLTNSISRVTLSQSLLNSI